MSHMIAEPETYFGKLLPGRDSLMLELEEEASREGIPIVGPVVGELLFLLARISGARRILELGAATGYSAIYLAGGCEAAGGTVLTLEHDPAMAERAETNLRRAGVGDRVEILGGDAIEALDRMDGPFDFIFLDIEKRDYLKALPRCETLLREGGLLVADNVAFRDAEDFNRALADRPAWRPVHLYGYLPLHSPERDALCVALRT